MRTEHWLVIFGALQALGAVIAVAQFLGITAQTVTGRGASVSNKYLLLVLGILLIIGAVVSGATWYSRTPEFKHLALSDMEQIQGRTFTNETVEMDGKYFFDCHFTNVSLAFRGEKEFALSHNKFTGPVILHTDNKMARYYGAVLVELLRQSGLANISEVGFVGNDDIVLQKLTPPSTP